MIEHAPGCDRRHGRRHRCSDESIIVSSAPRADGLAERTVSDWSAIAFVLTILSCAVVAVESVWTIYLASFGVYIETHGSPRAIDFRDIGIPIVLWLGSQEILGAPMLIATVWLA